MAVVNMNSSVISTPMRVYEYVVNGIREGRYQPAMKLSDRDIARELDIGHMTVREAMGKLAEHGWIERIPNRGAFVRKFSPQDVKDTYMLREIMEGVAIRELAEHATEEDIQKLRRCCEMINASSQNRNIKEYQKADLAFHRMSVEFTQNKRLCELFDALILQGHLAFEILVTKAVGMILMNVSESFEQSFPARHIDICNAIANHDPDLAEKLVRQHIRFGYEIISEMVDLGHNLRRKAEPV
jgi:DNA-binding GntR family transcriptional regulator